MRLSEFRIKNFRSIVDSGWNNLSPDNITTLIGQNESGKTSILEGFYSFWEGSISEDVLRSDMTFPEVTCSYTLEENESFDTVDVRRLPAGVLSAIKESNKLVLTRKWLPDMNSQILVSGEQIPAIFDNIAKNESNLREKTIKEIRQIIQESQEIRESIAKLEKNAATLDSDLQKASKKPTKLAKFMKRSSGPAKQETDKPDEKAADDEYNLTAKKIKKEEDLLSGLRDKLTGISVICEYGKKCIELLENLENTSTALDKAYMELSDIEDNIILLNGDKEKKAGEHKLYEVKENYIRLSRQMESLKEQAGISIRIVKNLTEGKEITEAEIEAEKDFASFNTLFTREEAGEAFFNCIPRHEFFEDFSSLLPNRIDIHDIFENNARVEGYKAVKNFLIIAGLDPQFFKQTNNRILKQKIENLNNEVTIDFQEYWRQNIGNDNKIRIHFELEHYDISHPEKKGKPYLEFWIKDEHERLYPKQRSRGVRWFLSFYLELKAFARQNINKERILLIDEPGLSLHARAQEDVLKVFEDIKGKIQIIYTTHSSHLIDHNKLYRLLAVQRAKENREQSETIIYNASHLHSATSDTLSPVSSLLGASYNKMEFARQTRNVIVEDISSFYYLSSLFGQLNKGSGVCFLPANGPAGVTTLVNLLIGWGFDFSVLLFDNPDNQNIINELQLQLAGFDPADPASRLIFAQNKEAPENLFSTIDFKKHIIKKRIGIPDSNFGFVIDNNISRPLLASSFAQSVASGNISIDSFDEETHNNLQQLFTSVRKRFRISGETV